MSFLVRAALVRAGKTSMPSIPVNDEDMKGIDAAFVALYANTLKDLAEVENWTKPYQKVLHDAIKEMQKLPDPLPIFRGLCLESGDEINLKEIGSHWTHKKDLAMDYLKREWKCKESNFYLRALIPHNKIDWYSSIAAHIIFPEEQEINPVTDEYKVDIFDADWKLLRTDTGKITSRMDKPGRNK